MYRCAGDKLHLQHAMNIFVQWLTCRPKVDCKMIAKSTVTLAAKRQLLCAGPSVCRFVRDYALWTS